MFRTVYQKGCFSILYSVGGDPLKYWAMHTKNGYVKRVHDEDINSMVFEIMGTNVSTAYIYSPKDSSQQLGIKLPFLVLLIKNLHKYFTFEVKIIDDQRFMRRFRVSNFQSKTSVKPFSTSMPMGMSPGWNQIHFNLADFTRRAYGTNYMETVRLQIHANVRIRRIYFTDRLYQDNELPNEYRLIALPKPKKMQNLRVPAARPPSPQSNIGDTKKALKKEKASADEGQSAADKGEIRTDLPDTDVPDADKSEIKVDLPVYNKPVTDGESTTDKGEIYNKRATDEGPSDADKAEIKAELPYEGEIKAENIKEEEIKEEEI